MGYAFIGLVLAFFVFTCLLVCISKVRLCLKSKKTPTVEPETRPTEDDSNLKIEVPYPFPRMSLFYPRVKPSIDSELINRDYEE